MLDKRAPRASRNQFDCGRAKIYIRSSLSGTPKIQQEFDARGESAFRTILNNRARSRAIISSTAPFRLPFAEKTRAAYSRNVI
jgi:hypothetical protein